MDGIEIEFSKETKYLGVILDNKLRWDSQINSVKERAIKALMACSVERWSDRDGA
jgi:hypothetical protein